MMGITFVLLSQAVYAISISDIENPTLLYIVFIIAFAVCLYLCYTIIEGFTTGRLFPGDKIDL